MKTLQTIIANVGRFLVALTFILSGFVKAVDPLGTQYKIEDYAIAMGIGTPLPTWCSLGASILLCTIEFCIGIMLLLAVRKRLAAWCTLIVVGVMTLFTLWIYIANPVSDCGCFGDALHLSNGQTLLKNIVLLFFAVIIFLFYDRMFRFLSDGNSSIAFSYSIFFIIGTALYSLYLLPPFDFRPYHIGVNLAEATGGTEESEPTIYDFFIETPEGEDLTEDILSYEGYTFLLIAPYLDKADDANFGPIDQLYEYAQEHGYPFYCLTSSSKKSISHWQDSTGAEYPFFFADGTTLKTVVRSNPGMLLLKDGVIIQKWSHNNLPKEEKLSAPLEELSIGKLPHTGSARKVTFFLLLFIVPIVVLSITDRLWAWRQWLRERRKLRRSTAKQQAPEEKTEDNKQITANKQQIKE